MQYYKRKPKSIETNNGTVESLKIYRPLGLDQYTFTITNEVDSIGNDIAEGRIHKSMFWPLLAKRYRDLLRRQEKMQYYYRDLYETSLYQEQWVDRYLGQLRELEE